MSKVTIKLPREAKVFLLEDSQERISWFRKKLGNTLQTLVDRADDAIMMLSKHHYDTIFLDHDLGLLELVGYNGIKPGPEGTGLDVANHLASSKYLSELTVIHSWNPEGAKNMKNVLPNAVVVPFGQFDIEII